MRSSNGIAVRNIEEFSPTYQNLLRTGFSLAAALTLFTVFCVALFLAGQDIRALFSAVAVATICSMLVFAHNFVQEQQSLVKLYHHYLATFSYQVLYQMLGHPKLSNWSRNEVERYLVQAHCNWKR